MIRALRKIKMINISDIIPNPYQIRRNFEKGELDSLAKSIKEVGILSPVILRRSDNGYEIVCGQRRVRAAAINKMKEVPAIIIKAGDAACAQLSIIENIHRSSLTLFEEAEGYYNLMMYHRLRKDKLLKALSVESFKFNEKVRLLSLGEKVRTKAECSHLKKEEIKELLRLHNEEKQLEFIAKIENEELSVKELRNEIDEILKESIRLKSLRENAKKKNYAKENAKMPLYINTVKKTVEVLRKNGADVEFKQTEDEKCATFVIKTYK